MELQAQENKTHPRQRKIILAHQNINCLASKTDTIAHFLHEETPGFVIITEFGLPQVNLENTCLEGYVKQDHKQVIKT